MAETVSNNSFAVFFKPNDIGETPKIWYLAGEYGQWEDALNEYAKRVELYGRMNVMFAEIPNTITVCVKVKYGDCKQVNI